MENNGWTDDELYLVCDRAYSLYLQGKHAEAAVLLAGAVALRPEDRYARYALATVCLALGHPRQSLAHLDVLIARDRDDIEARARRCEALLEAGDAAAAAAEFRELRYVLPAAQAAPLGMRLATAQRNYEPR